MATRNPGSAWSPRAASQASKAALPWWMGTSGNGEARRGSLSKMATRRRGEPARHSRRTLACPVAPQKTISSSISAFPAYGGAGRAGVERGVGPVPLAHHGRLERPADAEGRIVEAHASRQLGPVGRGDLVEHLGRVHEGDEAVRDALGGL